MALVETDAIVLRTHKLAEADKIVVCLTREAGVVRGVAHGARRLKSRYGAGLEPFTLVNLSYYEKEGRDLVSLREAEIVRSYFGLASDAERVAALAYMSELVIEFAPPHEPNERMFRMVSACLEAILQAPRELSVIVRYFEIWTLRLAGFLPDLRSCADCRRSFRDEDDSYLNAEGKLRCRECSNGLGTMLRSETYAHLCATQRLSPVAFARNAESTTITVRQELAEITQRLVRRALEREPRGQSSFV